MLHLGIIGLLIVNWTPDVYPIPPELVSPEDYAARFGLQRPLARDARLRRRQDDKGGGSGVKDPGAKDPKKQGGGQKIAGKEGKAGMNGKEDHTELPGDIKPVTNYGGLSEALADTGTDIRKTLNEIQTVTEALGGLNSNNVVLGQRLGHGAEGRGRRRRRNRRGRDVRLRARWTPAGARATAVASAAARAGPGVAAAAASASGGTGGGTGGGNGPATEPAAGRASTACGRGRRWRGARRPQRRANPARRHRPPGRAAGLLRDRGAEGPDAQGRRHRGLDHRRRAAP